MPLTPSEALVEKIAKRSFLSIWSEANPLARPGKELCDLLVACEPDVILVSVKEVALERSGDRDIDADRWRRRAIDKSVEQLYGAERQIERMNRVIRLDGSEGLTLPLPSRRRYHRIAVALGAHGAIPIPSGDWGKGFVHVLDEIGLDRILGELDTVTDVVDYLRSKEALARTSDLIVPGNESDLLAVYLHAGRRFSTEADRLLIEPGSWEKLVAKPGWQNRKAADAESYIWDGLIETLVEGTGVAGSIGAQGLDQRENALRSMARESRFARRVLAQAFNDFMAAAAAGQVRARKVASLSGVIYVFLATERDESREHRVHELQLRCFVARGLHPNGSTVVGIATERYQRHKGFSLDLVHLQITGWSEEHEEAMRGIQKELGYFASPREQRFSVDEYPS